MTQTNTNDGVAPTRTISRDEIVAFGRQMRPWVWLPIAAQVLAQSPGDAMVRFLVSANLAHLGLKAPALEQLDLLDPRAAEAPEVAALRTQVAALPDNGVDHRAIIKTARANLDALGERAPEALTGAFDAWANNLRSEDWQRTTDNQYIRRSAGETDLRQWRGLFDGRAMAAEFASSHLASLGEYPRPMTIEGIDPPWLLIAAAEATAQRPNGYAPRLTILQADAAEALDGLAQADMAELLAHDRVECFIGPDASARLEETLASRLDLTIAGPFLRQPGLRTALVPDAAAAKQNAIARQQQDEQSLRERVTSAYAGRDISWWSRRYAEAAAPGSRRPLRVLIPTTRYSTYIQHASNDLAEAFRSLGHEAEVVIEPDEYSTIEARGHLRAVEAFEPDLIVVINYPRWCVQQGVYPAEVPFVCWVQDAMPHLFEARLEARSGAGDIALDFLAGHITPELVERGGHDPARALPASVPASSRKFHDTSPSPELARLHECEVACATNHSETPRAMAERLKLESNADSRLGTCIDEILEAAEDLAPRVHEIKHHKALKQSVDAIIERRLGLDLAPESAARLYRHAAMPLLDRVMRHRALESAAAICDRRGWRLHLYGRGWEEHPTLAQYARGVLDHGEPLRASYHLAKLHLHISASTMSHQRIVECAMAGGLPGVRFFRDGLGVLVTRAQRKLLNTEPIGRDEPMHADLFSHTETPESMRFKSIADRLGLQEPAGFMMDDRRRESIARDTFGRPIDEDPCWLLGDPLETCFWDDASLESLIERAIERPAWRANIVNGIRRRSLEHCTHEAFARRLLEKINAELRAGASTATELAA
ncbi:MAG: hypothetical protein EA423_05160 [Phycisphaerales bacterium]|nr:MAG: hypothetical protein EA423_05160 [Phycisphaerales bacterium]